MITRNRTNDGVKLTFSLDVDKPVSVVGDFNDWDPAAHPLKPRTNGKRSVAVTLPPGSRYAFRYLADGGHFFDDDHADHYEDNGYGGTHGVLVLDVPHAVRTATKRAAAAKTPTATAKVTEPTPSAEEVPKAAVPSRKKAARPAASAKPTATRSAKKPKP